MVCVCNYSISEVEAEALGVQSYFQLCGESETSLGYTEPKQQKLSTFILVIKTKKKDGVGEARWNLS